MLVIQPTGPRALRALVLCGTPSKDMILFREEGSKANVYG